MSAYRLFVKNINNLTGKSITGSDLIVDKFSCKEDLVTKATSSFTVRDIPTVIEEGNIVGMYDQYGVIWYLGVITGYSDLTIKANQIISLFDDKWATKEYYYNNVFPLTQLSLPYENAYGGKVERSFDSIVVTSNTDNDHKEEDVVSKTITLVAGDYTLYVKKDVIDVDVDKDPKPMITIGSQVLYENTESGVFNLTLSASTTITFHSIGKVYNIYPILVQGTYSQFPVCLEKNLEEIIVRDFKGANDTYLAQIFNSFDTSTSSVTSIDLDDVKAKSSENLMSFLFSIYKQFGIIFNISIPYGEGRGSIDIGKNQMPIMNFSNNSNVITNFTVDKQIAKVNKLIIYSKNGVYRQTYYVTANGITTDPSVLNRITQIKTTIVYTDDDLETTVANKLDEELFNHEISCDLLIDNKLYKLDDFKLGRKFHVYYQGQYYDTVLTGKELKGENGELSEYVSLTFGLVRSNLTQKLFEKVVE